MFKSTKIFDGYSTCFRQWRAKHSHCQYLHGYSLKFKVIFVGELDEKNWVADFGGFGELKTWFKQMFDHTTVVAKDDPYLRDFNQMYQVGLIQLVMMDDVGCEKFAEMVFREVNAFICEKTNGRVRVESVECMEHEKNSAIYYENKKNISNGTQ